MFQASPQSIQGACSMGRLELSSCGCTGFGRGGTAEGGRGGRFGEGYGGRGPGRGGFGGRGASIVPQGAKDVPMLDRSDRGAAAHSYGNLAVQSYYVSSVLADKAAIVSAFCPATDQGQNLYGWPGTVLKHQSESCSESNPKHDGSRRRSANGPLLHMCHPEDVVTQDALITQDTTAATITGVQMLGILAVRQGTMIADGNLPGIMIDIGSASVTGTGSETVTGTAQGTGTAAKTESVTAIVRRIKTGIHHGLPKTAVTIMSIIPSTGVILI